MNEIKVSVNILSFFYLFIYFFFLFLLLFSIVHFTVTGTKEAEDDLVLIQPSSFLYYVNRVVLMLTAIFLA